MTVTKDNIQALKNQVLRGIGITRQDAARLLSIPEDDIAMIEALIDAASVVTRELAPRKASLCSLLNTKSGACSENCKFCSQSVHFNSEVETYPFASEETILKRAKEIESIGSDKYCLVTAGDKLSDEDFGKAIKAFKKLKSITHLGLDASIGFLTEERARRLREAGVGTVNHNLETGEKYYSKICTTHSYEDRKNTIRAVKKSGTAICSGGIIGMGETLEDRIDLAFTLKELDVDIVPINILDPRPGTPLEDVEKIEPIDVIKTVAVFRFILPEKAIKLAGGREVNLGDVWQPMAFRAGANGIIIGGYLTTGGNKPEKDLEMLEEAGYEIPATKGC